MYESSSSWEQNSYENNKTNYLNKCVHWEIWYGIICKNGRDYNTVYSLYGLTQCAEGLRI